MPRPTISEEAWDAMLRFFRRPSVSWLIAESESRLLAVLAELEATGSPLVGALLSPGLIGRSRAVVERGLAVQTALLERASPQDVIGLVESAQRDLVERAFDEHRRWFSLTPAALRDLAAASPASLGLLVLASSHHSGWVREAAVRALNGTQALLTFPVLVERLNDWVDAVRKAARNALRAYLDAKHAPTLIAHLDALVALERRSRDHHLPFLDQVAMVLKDEEARPALIAGIGDSRKTVRRRCWTMLAQVDPNGVARVRSGLCGNDPWIAARAAEEVRDAGDAAHVSALLSDMASSQFPGVRRLAIEIIVRRDGASMDLTPWLVDRAASVREWARFYLSRHDAGFNVLGHYRQLCEASNPPFGAVAGLAEMAVEADLDRLMVFVHDKRARIRLLALRAMARLAADEIVDPFITALDDRNAAVRSCAVAALSRRSAYLPLERLMQGMSEATVRRRLALTRIIALRRKGEAVSALCRLLDDADAGVRSLAEQALVGQIPGLIDPFKGRGDPYACQAEALLSRISDAGQRRLIFAVRRVFSDSRWPKPL